MKPTDILLAVLVALVWGFNFVVIKVGLGSFPPILFASLRFTCAAFPAIFFIKRGNIPWKCIVTVGITLGVVKFSLLFIGMDMGMPAGLSSMVLQSQAIFTLILSAIILKDSPTLWQWGGVLIAFFGIGLLVTEMSGNPNFVGLMLVICAGFAWGVSNILMKQAGQVDMLSLAVWMSIIPPIPLLLCSLLTEEGQLAALQNMTWTGFGAIAYIGFISTIFAFAVWGKLFRDYSPNVVAPFSLLVPVFGILSSVVVLGEDFSHAEVLATLFVLSGLLCVVFGNRFSAFLKPIFGRT